MHQCVIWYWVGNGKYSHWQIGGGIPTNLSLLNSQQKETLMRQNCLDAFWDNNPYLPPKNDNAVDQSQPLESQLSSLLRPWVKQYSVSFKTNLRYFGHSGPTGMGVICIFKINGCHKASWPHELNSSFYSIYLKMVMGHKFIQTFKIKYYSTRPMFLRVVKIGEITSTGSETDSLIISF